MSARWLSQWSDVGPVVVSVIQARCCYGHCFYDQNRVLVLEMHTLWCWYSFVRNTAGFCLLGEWMDWYRYERCNLLLSVGIAVCAILGRESQKMKTSERKDRDELRNESTNALTDGLSHKQMDTRMMEHMEGGMNKHIQTNRMNKWTNGIDKRNAGF